MDSLSQKLVEGIAQLADSTLASSRLPKTIECNIIKVEDAAIGLYTVAYMGNEFEVYSASPSIAYEENDIVLVLIPEGDISKTKYILGAANPVGSMYATSEDETEIKIVRDGVLLPFADVSLCSYTPSSTDNTCEDDDNYVTIIKAYLNSGSRKFVFNAKVQTKLPGEQQVRGNYGLLFKIPIILPSSNGVVTEDEHTWVTARMDVTTMLGDVYNFNDQAPQIIDFEIPENATYDDSERPTLVAFVDDNFIQRAGQPNDIFFTDINIKSVDYVPLDENNGNYLALVASEGNYFLSNTIGLSDTKTITPYLRINGKSKNIDGSYECYWYVEDSSVKSSSDDGYETHGKPGWRCLNQKNILKTGEDGAEGFQWITNDYTLDISKDDVETSLRYKCVLVQGSFIISGEIVIENLQATYEIELTTVNGATSFVKDLGEVHFLARIRNTNPLAESGKIRLSWSRKDKNGNAIVETDLDLPQPVNNGSGIFSPIVINGITWNQIEYFYPVKNITDYNTFYCTFYEDKTIDDVTKTKLIGTQYIGINTSEDNFEYKIYVQNDKYVYKYDADGDSPMVANYDGPSSSVVKEISPISFIIKDKNNNELTDIDYNYCVVTWMIPKNSMIILPSGTIISREDNDYYYIVHQGKNGSDLYYSIRTQYDVSKNNNTILLNIEFKQYSLNESVNLSFLKDGESGTNGTKFTAVITHDDKAYAEPYLSEGKVFKDKFMPVLITSAGGYGGGYGGGGNYGGDFGPIERIGVYQPRKEVNNEIIYNRIKLWSANVKQQITSGVINYLGLDSWAEFADSAINPIIIEWNSHPNADITLIQYDNDPQGENEAPYDCKFWILVGQYDWISSDEIQIKSGSTLYRMSTQGYDRDDDKILDTQSDSNYYYSYQPNYSLFGNAVTTYNTDATFQWNGHYIYETELVSRNEHGNIDPQFQIKIYKDGELFTDVSKYTVEWSMMDPKTCNTIFDVQADGNAGILTPTSNLYNLNMRENIDTCNIIKAKITINTEAAEQIYAQTLYAYYPIDIYFLALTDIFSEDTEYNLPDVDNGYWEVLYASDGTNPKFNSIPFNINSNNSKIADLTPYFRHDEYGYYDENGVIGEVKEVYVDVYSGTLSGFGAYWQGQHSSLFSELSVPSTDDTKLNAKPANKYENGIVKDYISCKTAYYDSALRDKAYDIYWEQQVINGELYDYSVILYNLPLFQHQLDNGQNFSYNNYKNLLKNSEDFLADRSLLLSYLNNLLQYLEDINEFINGKLDVVITPTISDSSSSLEYDAKDILLKLGDPDYSYGLYDIPNYLCDQGVTQLTFESFDDYKARYGLGSALILKSKIDACNELLTTYFNNINNTFRDLGTSFGSFCDFREGLYDYINNNTVLDNLAPEPTYYNVNFREKCKDFITYKDYLNTLFNELSTEEYQDYNIIKTKILEKFKSMYDEFDNRYNVKYQNASDNLQTLYNSLQQEYEDYEAALRYNFAFYYHPIHCAYNIYGFSDINSWDGQKLYIDPDGERFLYAPKIGSGYKTDEGGFTGIVMGMENVSSSSQQPDVSKSKIGLIGYDNTVQTMFLNARSGSAIFGKSGSGQLIIDPTQNSALLYSSNYWATYDQDNPARYGLPTKYTESNKTYQGMLIDLTNSEIHFGNSEETNYYIKSLNDINTVINIFLDSVFVRSGYRFKVDDLLNQFGDLTLTENSYAVAINQHREEAGTIVRLYYRILFCIIPMELATTKVTITPGQYTEYSKTYYAFHIDKTRYQQSLSIKGGVFELITDSEGSITGWNFFGHNGTIDASVNTYDYYVTDHQLFIDPSDELGNTTRIVYQESNSSPLLRTLGPAGSGESRPDYVINRTLGGKLYSGYHSDIDSTETGFYLDSRGISIGSKFKVTADGVLTLGNGAVSGSGAHWTINSNANFAYFSYNTDSLEWAIGSGGIPYIDTSPGHAAYNQVYIGTNGIRLGTAFAVDNTGFMIADGGRIGSWTIWTDKITSNTGEAGSSINDGIIIDGAGNITGPNWQISKTAGQTYFNDAKIGGWEVGTVNNQYILQSTNSGHNVKLDGNAGKITLTMSGNTLEISPTNGFKLNKSGTALFKFDTSGDVYIGEDWKISGSGIDSGLVYIGNAPHSGGGAGVYDIPAKITPNIVCANTGYFNIINTTNHAATDGEAHLGITKVGSLEIWDDRLSYPNYQTLIEYLTNSNDRLELTAIKNKLATAGKAGNYDVYNGGQLVGTVNIPAV